MTEDVPGDLDSQHVVMLKISGGSVKILQDCFQWIGADSWRVQANPEELTDGWKGRTQLLKKIK